MPLLPGPLDAFIAAAQAQATALRNERIAAALAAAGASDPETRRLALHALAILAADDANKQEMWDDAAVRSKKVGR